MSGSRPHSVPLPSPHSSHPAHVHSWLPRRMTPPFRTRHNTCLEPQLGPRGAEAGGLVWLGLHGTLGEHYPMSCAVKSAGPNTAACQRSK